MTEQEQDQGWTEKARAALANQRREPKPKRESQARVDDLPVGGRVWFAEEKRPYTVRARSRRYLVCNKPFFKTVLYCIIDLKTRMRSPEDRVFGLGAETTEQCEAMVRRLERGETALSRRHEAPLVVLRVERPEAAAVDKRATRATSWSTPDALTPPVEDSR